MSVDDQPGRQRRPRKKLTIGTSTAPVVELPLEVGSEIMSPAEQPKLMEDHANARLQLGFLVAISTGVGTAVAGSIPSLQWIGFAGPLFSISAFYIFGRLQGFAERSDLRQQFADSCYFLGFLLTMIAMLVGFLPAGLLGNEITSQGILRHFSMALGATALGLVFRILALQGGRSLGQIAAEVEATLTQYARNVSAEARAIGDELSALRGTLENQREQASAIVTTNLADAVVAAFGPITNSVLKISKTLEAQAVQISQSASLVQTAIGQSSEQIAAVASIRVEANETANAAVADIGDALRQFETNIAELQGQLAQVVSASSSEIKRMTIALEQGTALAPSLAPALEAVVAKVDAVSKQLSEVQGRSEELGARFGETLYDDGPLIAKLEQAQARVVANLDEASLASRSGIEREGAATRGVLEQVRNDFQRELRAEQERATSAMRSDAERFSGEISATTERLVDVLQSFARSIEKAQK